MDDNDQHLYVNLLTDALNERNELFEFVNEQVAELIAPLVAGIEAYMSLPRGYIEIGHCEDQPDQDRVVIYGTVKTTLGDVVTKLFFVFPYESLGTEEEPPNIDTIVSFLKQVDAERSATQRDVIIDMINRAELDTYYESTENTITDMHITSAYAETLVEYINRNEQESRRTLH